MIVPFDFIGSGLTTRDNKSPDWFEIAGPDEVFESAKAVIVGNTVVLSAASVPNPESLRFAWHHTAEPNLMNKEELPANCFKRNLSDSETAESSRESRNGSPDEKE